MSDKTKWIIALIQVLSTVKVAVGLTAIYHYARYEHVVLGVFHTEPAMALETAVAVVSGGICLFSLSLIVQRHLRLCHHAKRE